MAASSRRADRRSRIGLVDAPAVLVSGAVALAAIAGATVAVCLGHIDAGTYSGLVGVALGGAVGVGSHAAGVNQSKPQA